MFLTGKYGIPAAAIGSAIADTVTGYFLPYAPFTFVLKGLMAFAAFAIMGRKDTLPRIIAAAAVCEAIMFSGYFLFDAALYGLYPALGTLVFSLIQAAGGIVVGSLVCYVLKKKRFKDNIKYDVLTDEKTCKFPFSVCFFLLLIIKRFAVWFTQTPRRPYFRRAFFLGAFLLSFAFGNCFSGKNL